MLLMMGRVRRYATDEFLTVLSGVGAAAHGYTRDIVRILVVEDEQKVAKALREGLEAERYDVRVASTGEEGFFLVNHESFDLVVLDLMLPRRDGLEVLTTLRRRGLQTPVLILTAKDTVDDRVHGLDSGADDYLVKPFAFPELLARIRALLRRDRPEQALNLQQGSLEMDVVTRKVRRADREGIRDLGVPTTPWRARGVSGNARAGRVARHRPGNAARQRDRRDDRPPAP